MFTRLFIILVFIAVLTACEDTGPSYNTTDCIENKITSFEPECGEGAFVNEYQFRGQLLYLFNNGSCCCDIGHYVLSQSCDTLGLLEGFTGNTMILGEDFSHAVLKRELWP